IFVGDLDSRTRKLVVNADAQAMFVAPDHLLYLRGTGLIRQSFDLNRLEIQGDPVKIADEIILGPGYSYATVSVSTTGHMAYRTGSDVVLGREVGFVDRSGKPIGSTLATRAGNYMNPVFSSAANAVAVHRHELGSDIWIYAEDGTSTKLTSDPADDDFPVWS